jgi:hypothetical protein
MISDIFDLPKRSSCTLSLGLSQPLQEKRASEIIDISRPYRLTMSVTEVAYIFYFLNVLLPHCQRFVPLPKLFLLKSGCYFHSAETLVHASTKCHNHPSICRQCSNCYAKKQTPWLLVSERTIPTDRPTLVDEI